MKSVQTGIFIAVLLLFPALGLADYIILLHNGKQFITSDFWEEGGRIYFENLGGTMNLDVAQVKDILETDQKRLQQKTITIFADKQQVEKAVETDQPAGDGAGKEEETPGASKDIDNAPVEKETGAETTPDTEIKGPPAEPERAEQEKMLPEKIALSLNDELQLRKRRNDLAKEILEKRQEQNEIYRNSGTSTQKKTIKRELSELLAREGELAAEIKEKTNGYLPDWWNEIDKPTP